MASVIFDAIRENVATKADIAGVLAELALVEHRLLTRLGGLAVVLAGFVVTALHS